MQSPFSETLFGADVEECSSTCSASLSQFRAFHFLLVSLSRKRLAADVCSVAAREASGVALIFLRLMPARAWRLEGERSREHVDWLRRRTRAMCVTARAGGRAPHETQSIFNYFGTGARNRGATKGYSCRSQGTLAGALLHRTAAAHQPRSAGARPGLSHPGKGARWA